MHTADFTTSIVLSRLPHEPTLERGPSFCALQAPYSQPTQTLVQKPIVDLEFDEIRFLVGTGPRTI